LLYFNEERGQQSFAQKKVKKKKLRNVVLLMVTKIEDDGVKIKL